MSADQPFSLRRLSYIRALLMQAGYRENRHFRIYLGIWVLITVFALGATLLVSGLKSPLLLFSVPPLTFYVTKFTLIRMVRDRQKRIRFGLVDAFDLTAICVESGLAPNQAIKRVLGELREQHPDFCDELHIVREEVAAGCSWDKALCKMSERTGLEEISDLSEMIQAEPMRFIEILQNCANFLRAEYSQRVKIKRIVPALALSGAVFVLPMVLFVTLGPVLIQLYRTLTS